MRVKLRVNFIVPLILNGTQPCAPERPLSVAIPENSEDLQPMLNLNYHDDAWDTGTKLCVINFVTKQNLELLLSSGERIFECTRLIYSYMYHVIRCFHCKEMIK